MLGKLLKHEWKATARRYGLFYLILAAITLFAAIIHGIPTDNVFYNMGEFALLAIYVISLIGVFFCSTGMAIVRFYKNMVSDEGYLTFTLPVKVWQLVFSKLLVAFVWQIATVVLCILSLLGVFVVGHIDLKEFFEGVSALGGEFGKLVPVLGIMMIVSTIYQLTVYYLSMAIGQLFGTYKILASVIAYCALAFVIEIVIVLVVVGIFGVAGFMKMSTAMMTTDGMANFYLVFTGMSAVIGVAAYFVTCHLLTKKLNLV